MCQKFPGQLVLGIDARNGQVATEGWLETSEIEATELARDFQAFPLAAIVYTDKYSAIEDQKKAWHHVGGSRGKAD